MVLNWIGFLWISKLFPIEAQQQNEIKTSGLLLSFVLGLCMTLLLPAILLGSHRPATEFGIRLSGLRRQIRDGVQGFLLSIVPMALMMMATSPLRTFNNQNPLLRLLTESPNFVNITLVCLLAVVIAPLSEEMLFRVILQGWLSTVLRPAISIAFVVVAFAAIHGFPDALTLIPLATVLGWVFHRRHSYIAVVVIHFLFNATMLVLQLLLLWSNSKLTT
jgi:membrane protease YdiL (CAAX protease family)